MMVEVLLTCERKEKVCIRKNGEDKKITPLLSPWQPTKRILT